MPIAARLPRDRTTRPAITYRAKASECAELAAKTIDPQSKHTLEKTAEQWKALADGIEKYEAKFGIAAVGSRNCICVHPGPKSNRGKQDKVGVASGRNT